MPEPSAPLASPLGQRRWSLDNLADRWSPTYQQPARTGDAQGRTGLFACRRPFGRWTQGAATPRPGAARVPKLLLAS